MQPTWESNCGTVKLWLGDCVEVMRSWATNSVTIVTDPNYGIGAAFDSESDGNTQRGKSVSLRRDYGDVSWDNERPPHEAFDELRRVGCEQFIFGGNYFADMLPPSPSWYVWDKETGNNGYADCELAWTSHKAAVRKFRHKWQGMLTEPGVPKDKRIHPRQKPVRVMIDVIKRYTQPNIIVADPYCGSGTTLIASIRMGRSCWGVEREPDYFKAAKRRIEAELNRFPLLENVGTKSTQGKLFEAVT